MNTMSVLQMNDETSLFKKSELVKKMTKFKEEQCQEQPDTVITELS